MCCKFGFYVSGNATRLKYLLKSSFYTLVTFVLIDNKDNYELEFLCKKRGVPFFSYSYTENNLFGKARNKFISMQYLSLLQRFSCDYGIVFGGKILEGELLNIYEDKLINFHPSLLPAYKGINSIDQAIDEGALISGNTAHFIDSTLDGGKIIMQNVISMRYFTDYDDYLNNQLYMLIQICDWINQDRIIIQNNRVLVKDGTYLASDFYPNLEINKNLLCCDGL